MAVNIHLNLKTINGQPISGTGDMVINTINWRGSSSAAPLSPVKYDAYHNTTNGHAYIFTGSVWELLVKAEVPAGTFVPIAGNESSPMSGSLVLDIPYDVPSDEPGTAIVVMNNEGKIAVLIQNDDTEGAFISGNLDNTSFIRYGSESIMRTDGETYASAFRLTKEQIELGSLSSDPEFAGLTGLADYSEHYQNNSFVQAGWCNSSFEKQKLIVLPGSSSLLPDYEQANIFHMELTGTLLEIETPANLPDGKSIILRFKALSECVIDWGDGYRTSAAGEAVPWMTVLNFFYELTISRYDGLYLVRLNGQYPI